MLKAAPKELGYTIQQLTDESSQYQNLGGFTSAMLALVETKPGHLWWQQWGKGTPVLQFVARHPGTRPNIKYQQIVST